ncbi:hypothetical protein [Micromonospora avicenniae]|uniref:Uncharacterized protein n=1 Tax=Micromonospora avicenniae TaxID=1198245 RepID=A0A1N6PT09_9ACTN|nr:hypothetical protein [Micromonospora avicenniae]SIQ07461.1 hypothetical protein SAMN05444858_10113 [Micromonospora avicenniae]
MSDLPHPSWCLSNLCSPLSHAGRIIVINSLDGYPPVSLQLLRGHEPQALPLITLKGGVGSLLLTIPQARAVSHALASQARRAR